MTFPRRAAMVLALTMSLPGASYGGHFTSPVTVGGPGGTGTSSLNTAQSAKITKIFTSINSIDISFTAAADAANDLTPYDFQETITNMTGLTWTDFEVRIIMAPAGTVIGNTLANTPLGPGVISPDGQVETFSGGGTVPSGSTFDSFGIDIQPPAGASGTYILQETPSIPEPASLVLFGLGLLIVLAFGLYQRGGPGQRVETKRHALRGPETPRNE
jgi:hypothetical protein